MDMQVSYDSSGGAAEPHSIPASGLVNENVSVMQTDDYDYQAK